ncbi:hypothetical protein [Bradyrhizobium sp. SEMIA]|uniref:hypothetical protein n=1 Tax=Bradyrhizobium sp. SEMIA TaxID=2597515 RepID=UPI00223FF0A2|nr:hypothetical protein [Bradyrhizobium sp. SEMIA]
MPREGKPHGNWRPQRESDHFIRCTICGELLDMRGLSEVLELRGQQVEEEPTQH